MSIETTTYANWEKGKTEPVASQFRPVVTFLGYDPTPEARDLGRTLRGQEKRPRRDLRPDSGLSGLGPGDVNPVPKRHMAHPRQPDGGA